MTLPIQTRIKINKARIPKHSEEQGNSKISGLPLSSDTMKAEHAVLNH